MNSDTPAAPDDARLGEAAADAVAAAHTPEAPPQAAREHVHMPALDGLRGIAVLLVVVDHLAGSLAYEFNYGGKIVTLARFGWMGVDLFFVLSGFLITGILFDAKSKTGYFKNFYARRALRIFPLYYLAFLCFLLAYPLLRSLNLSGHESPWWMAVYLTNFVISAKGAGSFGMFDHFWSLAVEEHFYFVWPTIVFFCNRRTLMIVAGSAWVVALGLRLACVHGDALLPYAAYMATPMRMDSLAAGAFIALAARGPNGIAGLVRPAFIVGGAAMACFVAIVAIRRSFEPRDVVTGTIGMSLLWAFFAAALVLTLKWRPLTYLMSLDVLRWFGKYSYGMYVWHPIVFMIAFHNDWARGLRGAPTPLHAVLNAGAAVAVMLAVTLASWHLWERQFLKLKDRFA